MSLKVTILKPDGTKVDIEGGAMEVIMAIGAVLPSYQITTHPGLYPIQPSPISPIPGPVIFGDTTTGPAGITQGGPTTV